MTPWKRYEAFYFSLGTNSITIIHAHTNIPVKLIEPWSFFISSHFSLPLCWHFFALEFLLFLRDSVELDLRQTCTDMKKVPVKAQRL